MKLLQKKNWLVILLASSVLILSMAVSCQMEDPIIDDNDDPVKIDEPAPVLTGGAVFLLIDEESIYTDEKPNYFKDKDINDDIAEVGLRKPLPYFVNNVGKTIWLYTGQVGDEGWFAPKTIPDSWKKVGPTTNGTLNFFAGMNKSEDLLDKIPNVTPLRATGLAMLKGATVYAVVYKSDVSMNYDPLNGSLKGATLGVVALKVMDVIKRTDGSSSSLPRVAVKIENITSVSKLPLWLFSNAPVPKSSSEPKDITPPATYSAPQFVAAP
ncbi:MAG: hypothetical protein BWZ00_00733 [Bacteroidetes bacterium ADurb.BinA174]|nr:MAG: hypothetical protein BWZ00_00733 [Bacteroidetes bacterium ADurb.BinA174]